MKTNLSLLACVLLHASAVLGAAADAPITLETAPPVVIKTVPVAGAIDVDPSLTQLTVTFSKAMADGSWSWSTWGDGTFPETTGKPSYLPDSRTCVLPVKLEPGTFYATWLNSDRFKNFKDASGTPAVPYLLTFRTAGAGSASTPAAATATPPPSPSPASPTAAVPADLEKLNADQRAVLAWTDRQFRGFFDARNFEGWTEKDRADLESKAINTLSGPVNREYYQAINTLGALRSTKGLTKLRELAFDRREKDNRDRWMAIRALGLLQDRASVPEFIHLTYHGNSNTRWWAQITLVRVTGQNFASDWKAWGQWWNDQGSQPAFDPQIIRWWNGQAEPDQLAKSLAESDAKFLGGIRSRN
ncbi:MAG: Ig-like domain-containing protein [Verrucomicrobiales bacterium]|nr:Ig-like domain-containing protein [Verrucomicrobiales bacterium]